MVMASQEIPDYEDSDQQSLKNEVVAKKIWVQPVLCQLDLNATLLGGGPLADGGEGRS